MHMHMRCSVANAHAVINVAWRGSALLSTFGSSAGSVVGQLAPAPAIVIGNEKGADAEEEAVRAHGCVAEYDDPQSAKLMSVFEVRTR
jgi:hypothetical protein